MTNQPFGSISGDQLARVLGVDDYQLSRLVSAGVFPSPDVGANDVDHPTQWVWSFAAANTAIQGLTPTAIAAALKAAYIPSGSSPGQTTTRRYVATIKRY